MVYTIRRYIPKEERRYLFENSMVWGGEVLEDKPPKKALIMWKGKKYRRRIKTSDDWGWFADINKIHVRLR